MSDDSPLVSETTRGHIDCKDREVESGLFSAPPGT